MVVKMTNKNKKFYEYMGRFFGSRLIEKQTNDRIYDDDNKEWYIYIENNKVMAFVSINKNVIKNIYTTKEKYLEEILKEVIKKNKITYSTVPNNYIETYEKCGFTVNKQEGYKYFVIIYIEKEEVAIA